MSSKNIILSGIQPTGELHIGNYIGMIMNSLTLQDAYQCNFMIADLHSLTAAFDPKEKNKQILELATDMLALGFNPKKSTLFIQSHIHEHVELTWILNCIAPYSELQRMTQFKDKSEHESKNINMGLFDYPVLQAADILLYKPSLVPVGKDQLQHIELTRLLARLFNNKFGETFPEVNAHYSKETLSVKSLGDPTKKMSKSHGAKNYIALHDEPDVISKKLSKAVTGEDDSPGVLNLLNLLRLFSPDDYDTFKAEKTYSYKQLKELLASAIAEYFAEYREKKKELLSKPKGVLGIFEDGAEDARKVAEKTMKEVKEKVGLI